MNAIIRAKEIFECQDSVEIRCDELKYRAIYNFGLATFYHLSKYAEVESGTLSVPSQALKAAVKMGCKYFVCIDAVPKGIEIDDLRNRITVHRKIAKIPILILKSNKDVEIRAEKARKYIEETKATQKSPK